MSEGGIHDEPSRASISPGFQILRLNLAQCFHVPLIGGVEPLGSLRHDQFGAHVSAEIAVGGFPFSAFRIPVGQWSEFVLKVGRASRGQRFHARPVDRASLIE